MKTARVLSFPGFYCSGLSAELDMAEEQLVEGIADTHNVDAAPHMYDCSEYQAGFEHVAKAYADALGFEFDRMESPREYNFTTDRLYVRVDPTELYAMVDADRFAEVLQTYFTTGPGFISFYSNDPSVWRAKPLDTWDENELGALLEATLDEEPIEIDYEVYSNAVDAQTDFGKLGKALGVEL